MWRSYCIHYFLQTASSSDHSEKIKLGCSSQDESEYDYTYRFLIHPQGDFFVVSMKPLMPALRILKLLVCHKNNKMMSPRK